MEWYSILTTVLTVLAVPTLFGLLWKDLHERKKENNAENKKLRDEKRIADMRMVIKEETTPIREEIGEVKQTVDNMRVGDVTLLRDRMKTSLDTCKDQGYKTTSDAANWAELYNSYKLLGGNHFKEYVNAWKEEMDNLPTKEEYLKALQNEKNSGKQTKSQKKKTNVDKEVA